VLTLRSEAASDTSFLAELFAERAAPMLRLGGLPEAQVEQLVAMQHRAQTLAYQTQFPAGRFQIVELQGVPIGRLVEADTSETDIHIVDIALVATRQRLGIGSALVQDVQARQIERRGRVRAQAARDNSASRALFARLGFAESDGANPAYVDLLWPSPTVPQRDWRGG